MRIVLTSNASHDPARGGSTRSNLIWLEQLASNGHECLVVCSGEQAASIVRSARAIVAIGAHTRGYIREHLGSEAIVIHPPIYGAPPFARFGSFDQGWVLMINPCIVKGIGIFLALAQAFPQLPFAA